MAAPEARNLEIEALRAVAIALTLLQHVPLFFPSTGAPSWLRWIYEHLAFWSGVDLFFAISGYVVAASLLRGFDSAASSGRTRWNEVKRFWVRRLFRLLPAAWFWLALVLVATVTFNRTGVYGEWGANVKQAWWILGYAYNWVAQPMAMSGINIAPLSVYWSLSLEEQFYLIVPLLLLISNRRVMAGILVLVIAVQFFVWRPAPLEEYWWTMRSDALAWGVLLAFVGPGHMAARFALNANLAWLANLALLAALLVLPWGWFHVPVTAGVLAMVCASWVALAAFERGWVLPGCANLRSTRWFASRSYALYLAHVPCYMFIKEISLRMGIAGWDFVPWMILAGLGLACIAAEFSYRLIETPLREAGRSIATRLV